VANPESFAEYVAMDSAVAALMKALILEDDAAIVRSLDSIALHRDRLVNELQAWRPQLRIAANVY
jgi:hypothetical protein